MELLTALIIFTAGVIFGSVVSNIERFVNSASGTLRIDQSDSEKDVYRLEINRLDNLSKKRHVILKVDKNADLSQK